jgi:hypothetical protein
LDAKSHPSLLRGGTGAAIALKQHPRFRYPRCIRDSEAQIVNDRVTASPAGAQCG